MSKVWIVMDTTNMFQNISQKEITNMFQNLSQNYNNNIFQKESSILWLVFSKFMKKKLCKKT